MVDGMLFSTTGKEEDSAVAGLRDQAAAYLAALSAECISVPLAPYLRGEAATVAGHASMEVCLDVQAGSAQAAPAPAPADSETSGSGHLESMVEALGDEMWILNVSLAQAHGSYQVRCRQCTIEATVQPCCCFVSHNALARAALVRTTASCI